MAPAGPFKLVTVNTAPERAKLLIGRVVEDFKDKYTFIHAANVESKRPCSSMPCGFYILNRTLQPSRASAQQSRR